jgi:hypothetical protein
MPMETSAVIAIIRVCTERQLREISEVTGAPISTLAKIRYGVTTDPRASTIDSLRAYLLERPGLVSADGAPPATESPLTTQREVA